MSLWGPVSSLPVVHVAGGSLRRATGDFHTGERSVFVRQPASNSSSSLTEAGHIAHCFTTLA